MLQSKHNKTRNEIEQVGSLQSAKHNVTLSTHTLLINNHLGRVELIDLNATQGFY